MANDVHVHHPPNGGGGGMGWVIGVVVLVLLIILIWWLFVRGGVQPTQQAPTIEVPEQIDVDVDVQQSPGS